MTGDRTFIAAEVDAYEDTAPGAWHNRFRKLLIRFEKPDGELSGTGAFRMRTHRLSTDGFGIGSK
jgi:hypothetical protein